MTEPIRIQVGDEVFELTGAERQEFLNQRAIDQADFAQEAADRKAKEDAKVALLAKIGLTAEEAKIILEQ